MPSVLDSRSDGLSASEQRSSPDLNSPSRTDGSPGDWYVPSSPQRPANFILHDCMLSWNDVNNLFLYFAEFHLPHCGFLIRINSLAELAEDSELLLWTIILVAARHHAKYSEMNRALEAAHSRLRAEVCSEAIRKLPDLQAVLLLCMWPLPVKSQDGDTAGLRLAEALGCARQMGLDRSDDEILYSSVRAIKPLQKYSSRALRLTWLKCFELDVQLSLWHGILPALAASRYFRSVADICRSSDIPRSVAQNMDVYVQMARYLLLLDGTSGSEPTWNLAASFRQSLASEKESNCGSWSLENEVVSEACQMYISMTSYVHITRQQQTSHYNSGPDPSTTYAREHLLDAKSRATNIINRLCTLTDNAMSKDQTSHAGTTPLPGHPKNVGRLMFFATCVLLKYTDSETDQTPLAQEEAGNAFQQALSFFHCCPKATSHFLAGDTLEIAGRVIAQRQARLQSYTTTRMGASIMHDVRWLSGQFRCRGTQREETMNKLHASMPAENGLQHSISTFDWMQDDSEGSTSNRSHHDHWSDWCYSGADMLPSSMDLPAFEMWDDVLDGVWQNDLTTQDFSQWETLLR